MSEISVGEFEKKVLELEEILIIVRVKSGTMVADYDYARCAAGSTSVTNWLEGRIKPLIQGNEVIVVGGDHSVPHGRTKLDRLRTSYEV